MLNKKSKERFIENGENIKIIPPKKKIKKKTKKK